MDDLDLAGIASSGHIAPEVAERVRAVLASAEAAAGAVRHEADRAVATRRRMAEEEAQGYLDQAKRNADEYLQQRLRRISELSDGILDRAEAIVARLDRAEEVRRQLEGMVVSLGQTAEQLAAEAAASYPRAQPMGGQGPRVAKPAARPTEPQEPVVEAEPVPEAERLTEPEREPVADAEPVVDEPRSVRPAPDLPDEEGGGVVEFRRSAPRAENDDQLAARLVALQMAVAGGDRGEVETHLRQAFDLSDPSGILDDVFGRGTGAGKRVSWPEAADDGA